MEIFISHASETKSVIREFCSYLPNHINIWLDQDSLDLGVRLPDKLETAIKEEVEFFVLFFNREALESSWVNQEITWAMDRENELNRPFILPVLLQGDCLSFYESSDLGDKLYLECFDHSVKGIENASKKLADYLFALVSRQFGNEQTSGPKKILESLNYDLTRFKELAFSLQAALGDGIALIASSEQANAQLICSIVDYNDFTAELMQRLTTHNINIKKHFGNNLGEQCTKLLNYLEKDVYRGQIFALNQVRDKINNYELMKDSINSADVVLWDQEKTGLLLRTQVVLDQLTRDSGVLMESLEKEL